MISLPLPFLCRRSRWQVSISPRGWIFGDGDNRNQPIFIDGEYAAR